MTKTAWTPWHEVARLRDDLRSGDLSLSLFAADLYEVAMQRGARPIYENPVEFFTLTYVKTCAINDKSPNVRLETSTTGSFFASAEAGSHEHRVIMVWSLPRS
jgi:hypothetical protein